MKTSRVFLRGSMLLIGIAFLSASVPYGASAEPLPQEQIERLTIKLHDDLQNVARAYEDYQAKQGRPPENIETLVAEGMLTAVPETAPELAQCKYEFVDGYDDLDGKGIKDVAVYTTSCVPIEVCQEFNRRYAQAPLNDGTVFDYEAAGNAYPGKVFGQQMKVYAIKWAPSDELCELNWVLEYK